MLIRDVKTLAGALLVSGPEGTKINEYAYDLCQEMLDGSDGDFLLVRPSGKNGYLLEDLDKFRELIKLRSEKKVFLFYDIHLMPEKLQDTLLKSLEDYTNDKCIIVLTTSNTECVLSTIKSRCLKIETDLRIGANEDANLILDEVAKASGIDKAKLSFACANRPLWLIKMHEEGSLKKVLNCLEVLSDEKKDNRLIFKALGLIKEKDENCILNDSRASQKALHLAIIKALQSAYVAANGAEDTGTYSVKMSLDGLIEAGIAMRKSLDNLDICTASDLLDTLSVFVKN